MVNLILIFHIQEQSEHLENEMRQAAFKVYASLGANEEDIRKRVSTWQPAGLFCEKKRCTKALPML